VAWAEALTRETSGNPFFLREALLHLGDGGAWAREDGSAPPTLEALGLPDTVRQVIMRRLARLSDATGQLLRVAAAFTGGIDFEVARRVAGLEERDALNALGAALGAQLLAATGAGATAYDFTHALVRHTLYEGLSPARQARLHRAIAEMMEAVYEDRAGEHAAAVAQQYHCSKDLAGAERGVTYAVTAADRAEAMYTHDEVVRLLRIGVELTPQNARRPARLLGRLALGLTWVLNFDEAVRIAHEAGELIASAEDTAAAADYLGEATINLADAGSLQSAFEVARQGMTYIGERRDRTWLRLASHDVMRREEEDAEYPGIPLDCPERREMSALARSLSPADLKGIQLLFPLEHEEPRSPQIDFMSTFRGSLAALEERATDSERQGRTNSAAFYFAGVARCRLARGEIRAAEQGYAHAVALRDRSLVSARPVLGFAAYRFERCTVVNEGWTELLSSSGTDAAQPAAEHLYAWAAIRAATAVIFARLGHPEAALQALARLLPALERGPAWAQIYPAIACNAAATLWCIDHVDHAECIERNLRDKVVAPDSRFPMVDARLALAQVCALQRRYDEAVAWFARARAILDEQGARPLRAIVDYDEALMYVRRGESRDATRAFPLLEAALRQFHAVGMPGWIRDAQALLEKCGRRTAEGGVEELPSAIPDPQAAMQTVSCREDPLDDPSSSALPSATAAAIPPTRAAATDGPNVFRREGESDPGDPGSDDAAVFRREGDVWTVTWAGRTVRLRDARGFAYLAVLLRHPDRELHATDVVRLAGGAEVGAGPHPRPDRELATSPDLGHAGTILDARAHTAYRARLAELREELPEAEGRNDLGRIEHYREEIAALVQQLSGAKRGRTAAAHGERACVAVTKGLKGALERIAATTLSWGDI
jgi:tetratricopeptide (TPR) repeat protein